MLKFYFKESLKLIGRAKASFFLAVLASTLSIGLITFSTVLILFSNHLQDRLKDNIRMNIFLEENLSLPEVKSLQNTLKQTGYFTNITFISKEKAAERFVKETGEDFRQILDYNPLPASIETKINGNYISKSSLNKIKKEVSEMDGVSELILDEKITSKILDYIYASKKIIFISTAFLLLLSIYIISSTTKLLVSRKYEELETMKLVGARLISIKAPIYLNSLFIGLSASFFVIVCGYLFSSIVLSGRIPNYFSPLNISVLAIVLLLLGPGFSLLVTIFSLKKVTLKI